MPNTRSWSPARVASAALALVAAGLAAVGVAAPVEVTTRLNRAQIETPGATLSATLPGGTYSSRAARITLRFVDTPLALRGGASWNYTLQLTLTPLAGGVPAGAAQPTALTIFRGADREMFEAVGQLASLPAGEARLQVTAVDALDPAAVPQAIELALTVSGEPAVSFAPTQKPLLAFAATPLPRVTGTAVPGAIDYDFEWVYVDSRETSVPADPFRARDPIRMTSATPELALEQAWPAGRLVVRMRATARFAGSETRRLGRWSDPLSLTIGPGGQLAAAATGMNWHFQAHYSAATDVGSMLTFADGGLRARQVQKGITSEGSRLVTETKYDGEGRPVVNFLQTPVDGHRYQFEPRFNAVAGSAGTAGYDRAAFDSQRPQPAAGTSGAGAYFAARPVATGRDAYVPDAGGYPFSAVEHTREGSGRLRRSGGYGAALALGSGRETSYFYGDASSTTLRRLFGRDIGRALHYERNVEVDPNQVARVAYLDRQGRAVATALTGAVPASIASIAPPPGASVRFSLDESNQVDVAAGRSRSVNRVVNEATSDLFFRYDLTGVEYGVDLDDPRFPPLCASCRYRLRVRITGPNGAPVPLQIGSTQANDPSCGCPVVNGQPVCASSTAELDVELQNPTPAACPVGDFDRTFTRPSVQFCAKFAGPGEYEIVKELTLVSGSLDELITETSGRPGFFVPESYQPPADTVATQCGENCEPYCQQATRDDPSQLAACIESCRNPQNWAIPAGAAQQCDSLEAQLAADLAPGGSLAGQATHPEACHVGVCRDMQPSNIHDMRMTDESQYSDALCKGYLTPLGNTPGAPAVPPGCTPLLDPFFQSGGIGAQVAPWMRDVLADYTGRMPGFDPSLAGRSIWQLAADPTLHQGNLPSPDQQWRLFRSLYLGAKQTALVRELETPGGTRDCPYWNDERARVKRPHTFQSSADVLQAAEDSVLQYCDRLCPARVSQWLFELERSCGPIAEPKRSQVQQLFEAYCGRACGLGNPLAVLTTEDAANDPALLQAQALLPGCSLSTVAVDPPYVTERICNTTCCTSASPTPCAQHALQVLRDSGAMPAGATRDITDEPAGRALRERCLPWVVFAGPDKYEFLFLAKNREQRCRLVFLDAQGNRVATDGMRVVAGPYVETHPGAAAPAGLSGTGLALEVEVGGVRRRVYLFSDCPIDWLDGGGQCTTTTPTCTAPPAEDPDRKEPYAAICVNDRVLDKTRVPWFARTSNDTGKRPRKVAGAQPFAPADAGERALACRPCLQSLLQRMQLSLRGDRAPPDDCFTEFERHKGSFVGLQPSTKRECRTALLDSRGQPLDPLDVLEIAQPASASLGAGLPATPGGLSYTGIVLQVRTARGWEPAYLFSSCELPETPGCGTDCGISLRVDPCMQDVIDTLARTERGEERRRLRCASDVRVDDSRVIVERLENGKRSRCSVVLVDERGRPIAHQSVLRVLGAPSPSATAPSPRLGDRLDFAGFTLEVEIEDASGNVAVITVFVYTDCGFRLEEDCRDVVVDWPLDPPPFGDPTEVCVGEAEDLAVQEGLVRVTRARGEFDIRVRTEHHNRCFGPGLRESFSYATVPAEYHYTLRYFDQADNLIASVPPAGVRPLAPNAAATIEAGGNAADPAHDLVSRYQYDSRENVTRQYTPDAGAKRFWYDAAGQLRFSQSAQQSVDGQYAYVRYDALTRVIETGIVAGLAEAEIRTRLDDPDFPAAPQQTLSQRVRTVYDVPTEASCAALAARHLRGRAAAHVAEYAAGNAVTCYSYDPHGNIEALLQILPGLEPKRVDYAYDVVDGKVHEIRYQTGQPDQLLQRFIYDADRRLVATESSRDGLIWERDARYGYYRHGPLARVELGADAVQGVDRVYAVSGWPKGVNSDTLEATRDPGHDGAVGSNAAVARDLFGSAVHYFPGDFVPAGVAAGDARPQAQTFANTDYSAYSRAPCLGAAGSCGLYDGNVAGTVIAYRDGGALDTLGFAYRYDSLYRLRKAVSFADLDATTNRWPVSSTDPNLWRSEIDYDANGNIERLRRSARFNAASGSASRQMDDLTYRYALDAQGRLLSNRLLHVTDAVAAGDFADDVDDHGPFATASPATHNFAYDAGGRLIRDRASGIEAVTWNASDQARLLDRGDGTLEFLYDGLGQRVAKIYTSATAASDPATEFHVRDENGEILATYRRAAGTDGNAVTRLVEHTLQGIGRIGTWSDSEPQMAALPAGASSAIARYGRLRGAKQYELNNHLGHVFATVADIKRPVVVDGSVDHYEAVLRNRTDYEVFGSFLEDRAEETSAYRFGFAGFERDDELRGAGNGYYTHARLYDPRLGRWLSPDPAEAADLSPYVGFSNNPLRFGDPTGRVSWDGVKDTASNLGATFADMGRDLGKMGVGVVEGVADNLSKAKAAYKSGEVAEAAGWAIGINGTLESLAQKTVEWDKAGASTDEIVGLAVGELSGMNRFMEGYTGETLEGEKLPEGERYVRLVTGATQVIGTAGAVAGGVTNAVKPKTPGVKPPAPKPTRRILSCSFDPQTLVETDRGAIPIADVRAGDRVLARDDATGAIGYETVELAYSSVHDASVELTIESDGETTTVLTTPEHPFWVEGEGWTPAGEIPGKGARVAVRDGWAEIRSVLVVPGDVRSYNLDVAGADTFFAGDAGAWVHNCDLPSKPKGPHKAKMKTFDKRGTQIAEEDLVSGGSGKKKPTWTEQGEVHTEGKGVRSTREKIDTGVDVGSIEFEGQLPPCTMCKGRMNKLHRETQVPSTYKYPGGEPWKSTSKPPRSRKPKAPPP